jgi:hypothetical protein
LAITIESLKTVSLPQDRTLGRWRSSHPDAIVGWEKLANVDQYDKCLIEGKMMDTIEGDYAGIEAAKESDFFVPFVHLMWQQVSYCGLRSWGKSSIRKPELAAAPTLLPSAAGITDDSFALRFPETALPVAQEKIA